MNTRTIYIVDDNVEFLESTRFWLSGAGFDVRTYGDPMEAVQALSERERSEPACLMLDVRMPQLSGLDLHDALIDRGAQLPVIYMSGHADVPLAVQAMQKGAVTMLEKPFDEGALEAAIESAFALARRAPAADSALADAAPADDPAAEEAHSRFKARETRLTPRERQVLGFVIQGIYNKNIADRVGLSIKTVELYRARGMAKMQARSVAELTRMMVTQQA
jgi:two-component system, LuxR family, response regulator FixJ